MIPQHLNKHSNKHSNKPLKGSSMISKKMTRRLLIFMVVIMVGLTFSSLLDARVGGGHDNRDRSVLLFMWRRVRHSPEIEIPIVIIIILYHIFNKKKKTEPKKNYSNTSPKQPPPALAMDSAQRDRLIQELREEDKNFSMPLFLDFARLLFTDTLSLAGKKETQKLKPYLSDHTRDYLDYYFSASGEIRDIVIGNCTITRIDLTGASENKITLNFEASYTTTKPSMAQSSRIPATATYYLVSRWELFRKKGVVSKGPGEVNKIGCIYCGAPLSDAPKGRCPSCRRDPRQGKITWYVGGLVFTERTRKSPDLTKGFAKERSTYLDTRYQHGLEDAKTDFVKRYPDFNKNEFYDTAAIIFKNLLEAWSSLKWESIRPYVTDSLFQSHLYWINLYKKELMRNVLKDIAISGIHLVKIQSDRYYDSLTVRIHASMIDYTETLSGNHVSGNTRQPRNFSKYWTFIRSTDSDLGWVLSQIEEDDSYTG
jgi:predicted lipid-binding transport protein (Tim44 family)